MAPVETPAFRTSLPLARPGAWDEAAKLVVEAVTLAPRVLAFLGIMAAATVVVGFGLLLATVAAPVIAAAAAVVLVRARRARTAIRLA